VALSLFSGKNKIINLEIKDHVIRFAELKQGFTPVVSKCGERLLDPGIIKDGRIMDSNTFKLILEECIRDWKLQHRQVRFLVPDSYIVIRKLEIPNDIADDEMNGYLYLELGSSIHLPFDEPVFDTVLLGEKNGKKEILLFAAPESIVEDYRHVLEECKLKPIVADISPLSIYRLYDYLEKGHHPNHVMVIQFDMTSVNHCIFYQKKPVFMRHNILDIDAEKWEKKITGPHSGKWIYNGDKNVYFQFLEDVFKEIEKVMSFYKYSLNNGQTGVEGLIITGDHPFIKEITKHIEERFELPLKRFDEQAIHFAYQTENDSSYYVLIGLGLKGVR
jgi:type IV pilus assembly protein PilM